MIILVGATIFIVLVVWTARDLFVDQVQSRSHNTVKSSRWWRVIFG